MDKIARALRYYVSHRITNDPGAAPPPSRAVGVVEAVVFEIRWVSSSFLCAPL